MPATHFIHPITGDRVPFDYFDTDRSGPKGRHSCQPWLARFIAEGIANDVRHAGLDLTTTRTMGCPRQTFIEVTYDYGINPRESFAMRRGTAMHAVSTRYWSPEHFITEHGEGRALCTLPGQLFGVPISGQVDVMRIEPGTKRVTEILDSKFPCDFSVNFRGQRGGEAKVNDEIQLNINRLLLDQQPWAIDAGYDPDNVVLTIDDHSCGGYTRATPIALWAEHLDEATILNTVPANGKKPAIHTVAEIIAYHEGARLEYEAAPHEEKVKGDARAEVAARIPLVGETQWNHSKCDKMCEVRDICNKLVREHGRPGDV